MKEDAPFPVFAITNPHKAWVSRELDKLIDEWTAWNNYSQSLGESPDYHPNTCTEALKDGAENRRKHELLREKTLVFLRNHFSGAEFVFEKWPKHPHENSTSRLAQIVPIWIHRLETLKVSMEYVLVPDGYWNSKGKELVDAISRSTPQKAAELAALYLKDPFAQ